MYNIEVGELEYINEPYEDSYRNPTIINIGDFALSISPWEQVQYEHFVKFIRGDIDDIRMNPGSNSACTITRIQDKIQIELDASGGDEPAHISFKCDALKFIPLLEEYIRKLACDKEK